MKKKELLLIFILFMIDQGSKFWMEEILRNGSITIIPNFFELELVYNKGASFGILENQSFFLILVSIVCLFLLIRIKPTIKESNLRFISFSVLYAGMLGNLIDRIIYSHVKDFLSFQIFHYDFPVFNFADICIVIGGILFGILLWRGDKDHG